MDLNDFRRGQVWGITAAAFDAIARQFFDVYKKATAGDLSFEGFSSNEIKIDDKSAQRSSDNGNSLLSIDDDVAIITITGALTKRSTFWSRFFGSPTYQDIADALDIAINDDSIGAILLRMDSPGGVVNGVESLGNKIYAARSQKPIVAFADGLFASAAYWLGSAADVLIGSRTSEVGSIGVLMTHVDWSQWERNAGIKTTYLSAGAFKTLGNDSEPLSEKAREVFQGELDKIYSVFVEIVARNRETTVEDVRGRMADGRVFIGDDAVEVGLIDEIGSFETAIETARSMIEDEDNRTVLFVPRGASATVSGILNNNQKIGGLSLMKNETKGIQIADLTVEILTDQNPGIVKAIADATRDEIEKKAGDEIKTVTSAMSDEKQRVIGLAKAIFGNESGEKFEKVIESGITVEQYEAIADIGDKTAGDDKRGEILDELHKAGADDVGTGGDVRTSKDFASMVAEYQNQYGVKYTEALRAVRRAHPEAHAEYLKKVN